MGERKLLVFEWFCVFWGCVDEVEMQNCWFSNAFVCPGGVDCGKVLVFEWFWASQGYATARGRGGRSLDLLQYGRAKTVGF